MSRTLMVAAGLCALIGCGRATESSESLTLGPTEATSASPAVSSTGDASAKLPDRTSTVSDRRDVLERLLGPSVPAGWSAESAYDLGSILMATVVRPSDAQPVTVFSVTRAGAGFTTEQLDAAFSGAPGAGPHPLEVLGYDLVQPRSASKVTVGTTEVPSLDYAWLRVDPDSGVRDNGSGSAIWLRCGDDDARFLLLSSEMPAGRYDARRLGEFATALDSCSR